LAGAASEFFSIAIPCSSCSIHIAKKMTGAFNWSTQHHLI